MSHSRSSNQPNGSSANAGFEAKLWLAYPFHFRWVITNLKSLARLTASILFLASTALLPAVDGTAPGSHDEVVERIRVMADRHVQAGKEMDTSTVISIFEPYINLISRQEIAEAYESAFLEARKRHAPSIWDQIKPNAGWLVAIAIFLGALLKAPIQKWAETFADRLFNFARRRFTAWRFIRNANLRSYCRALIERHSKLQVPFSRRELVLRDIFVPLRVASLHSDVDMEAREAMCRYRRVVVTGNPGAGKSVLLNHLTLCFAEQGWSEIDRNAVPVLLPLHRVREVSATRTIQQYLVEELERCKMPAAADFLAAGLETGTLMLLFDGLDEVNRDHRRAVVEGIKDLMEHAHRDCHSVITCRTAVYEDDFFGAVDEHLVLADFVDHQIIAFLQPWEKFMPEGRSVEHLLETLRDRPRIMAMARNPLQLTMICSLYADEHAQFTLPHSRTEFYQRATHLFLDRWHKERNLYGAPLKAAVLEHLGLQIHVLGGTASDDSDKRSAPFELVQAQVAKVLPRLNLDTKDAVPLLSEIVERSGLLLRIDGGERLQFAHLTIQEYFAAQALLDQPAALLSYYRADSQHWREVLRLWCGSNHDCSNLVQDIFSTDPVMGLECVADGQRIDDAIASKVTQYFREHLEEQITSGHANILEAYAAVASNPRPRGQEMLDFLAKKLRATSSDTVRRSVADALASTNLPAAAKILFEARQHYPELSAALVSMGDLAVLVLRPLLESGHITAIADLVDIGTPQAALPLVPRLWDSSDEIRESTAWALASMLTRREIEQALRNYPLAPNMVVLPQHTWAWNTFAKPNAPALTTIANRVAECLTVSRAAPEFILGKPLEPRLAAAVAFAGRKREVEEIISVSPVLGRLRIAQLKTLLGKKDDEELVESPLQSIGLSQRFGSRRGNPLDLKQARDVWEVFLDAQPKDNPVACLLRGLPSPLLEVLTTVLGFSSGSDLRADWKTMHQPPPRKWWKWVTGGIASLLILFLVLPALILAGPILWSTSQGWSWHHIGLGAVAIAMLSGCVVWGIIVGMGEFFEARWRLRWFWVAAVVPVAGPTIGPFVFSFLAITEKKPEKSFALVVAILSLLSGAPALAAAALIRWGIGPWSWWGWAVTYLAIMSLVQVLGSWQSFIRWRSENPFRDLASHFGAQDFPLISSTHEIK